MIYLTFSVCSIIYFEESENYATVWISFIFKKKNREKKILILMCIYEGLFSALTSKWKYGRVKPDVILIQEPFKQLVICGVNSVAVTHCDPPSWKNIWAGINAAESGWYSPSNKLLNISSFLTGAILEIETWLTMDWGL